jgi:biotin carboxyl carrier protein
MRRYTIEIDGRRIAVDVEDSGAERLRVVVDGRQFDVSLGGAEDLGGSEAPAVAPPAVAATAARSPAPASADGGAVLRAPMPGVILRVLVAAGAQVQRGQDIAVLEAMKMENVIRAPQAGTIAEVCVQPGQQVAHGAAIVNFARAAPGATG